jgi:mannose-6-phosphate isomerase-like protein (cupin superfamily)
MQAYIRRVVGEVQTGQEPSVHPDNNDEILVVLEGQLTVNVNGEIIKMGCHDALYLTGSIAHKVLGGNPSAVFLSVLAGGVLRL